MITNQIYLIRAGVRSSLSTSRKIISQTASSHSSSRCFSSSCFRPAKREKVNPYTETLLLPKTKFPLRAEAAKREHMYLDRCTKELYPWQLENNPKSPFILHDGPPYANGNLHSGHALNRVLKDIVNRHKVMLGHKVIYRPGWDCHGLPIEMKALEEIRKKGTTTDLSPVEIRRLARKKALFEVERQKKDVMSWGVLGEWENPYMTLTKDYEIRQLQLFHDMIKKGYIYRQLKPVYWSPSSRSALAEAELEYNENHVSQSIHVGFPIKQLAPAIEKRWKDIVPTHQLQALIWTTTPWTIPSNKAISVHPQLSYSLVEVTRGNTPQFYIVGTDCLPALQDELNLSTEQWRCLDHAQGSELVDTEYIHPFYASTHPIIAGEHVTAESGTGLVHTAPGHGMDDYEVCIKMGIQPFSPLDDAGKYTKEAGPEFVGKDAFTEGNSKVISTLQEMKALVHQKAYVHKYPYDWRTKKPIMLRATAQWFANVETLQKEAVKALDSVRMIPAVAYKRLEQFTLSRKEWCISRQRAWGVPIPALYDVETGEALMTEASVQHIIQVFSERGTDAWWEEPKDNVFVAPEYQTNGKTYRRGYDTMDVWFDSGTSWTMLKDIPDRDPTKPVADVYLEGSDQHRGWFQSSLLTSIATTGKSPYSTLITHGFVLDEAGYKMSKSLGNVMLPTTITHGGKDKVKSPAYGTDVLRMWVASCEYTKDVSIGPTIIAQVSDMMRKIRTTARFMLGNLHDFHSSNSVPFHQLKEVDHYMLHELYQFNERISYAYDSFSYNRVVHDLQYFTTNTLSAFYFDVIKDRLYNEKADGESRRMAQTVLYEILNSYTTALAPLACLTAEEIYEDYRAMTPQPASSIFKKGWLYKDPQWSNSTLEAKWAVMKELKNHVNQVLEYARQDKILKSSQEAQVCVVIDQHTTSGQAIHAVETSELASFFLTAQVHLNDKEVKETSLEREITLKDGTVCKIHVERTKHHKCPRCWNYQASEADILCSRCTHVLSA
ncbi:isoleucyl-tRNA synthetase [Spinellus fusiger]|nr:isoleucyl-tRNA synthetase [Spinellus fusiger]